ncbi:hypothetical protein SAMN05660297_02937 [Natronincola peptidivorans]|uniref:Uncharacterized protein n=1 Tax=Natronincola peptidivorans TaxID=426128 RepID=A0A1I0FTJ5_9FIRM|nr:hypothetical protein [Natronincola peptidivorans]SET61576.1 hypothetical protein SAMN05660297_02937 [Natronincola peptidivorans]
MKKSISLLTSIFVLVILIACSRSVVTSNDFIENPEKVDKILVTTKGTMFPNEIDDIETINKIVDMIMDIEVEKFSEEKAKEWIESTQHDVKYYILLMGEYGANNFYFVNDGSIVFPNIENVLAPTKSYITTEKQIESLNKLDEIINKIASEYTNLSGVVMELYSVASMIPMIEDMKSLNEMVTEIDDIIEKLNDEKVQHFSKEAEEHIEKLIISTGKIIEYHRQFIEIFKEPGYSTKATEIHEQTLGEVTNLAELVREYAGIYSEFKSSSS